ncbi:ROK family protein [Acuticoccus sp. I52.16.1]|uniref:ROK family transcriptional regulator n=1 Tax=Acuticoccus sp. I52.16.1 TaxID=2928472 RepID=UPI001FCFFCAE|nr:ROK family protein [Acuticoccus sp. I52.16.1]UOM34360.1 ROK family protein [Acuticoccus sp. I52.16.1]
MRQRLFECLRAAGASSRADLARWLDCSPASVTSVAAELIEAGLVRELDGPREIARGRPPVSLAVAPDITKVAGIKLTDDAHTAVVIDFSGAVLSEATMPSAAHRQSLTATLDEAETLLDMALAEADLSRADLSWVGLGLPGVVDHASGVARWSPLLTQRNTPLREAFGERIGLPVAVDNDANLLALAELWFGAGRAMTDFAVVTIENGVGMGLVLGNRVFRGGTGLGMELGHTKVQLDGALCRCGSRGCLEAYVADYALVREAQTALHWDRDTAGSARALLETLYAEAKAGHKAALSIFNRAGRYLAVGLANVTELFDPHLIILSGGEMRFDFLYADAVLAEVEALTRQTGRAPPKIEINAWGDMVWARGAAALALASLTEQLLGETRPGGAP